MIEFFFDCSSPWTYLAFHNIQPMATQLNVEIVWRPILVGGDRICNSIEVDSRALLDGIVEQRIKDKLRANTEELIRRGGFGSPTMFVGTDMYFGNDRLTLVRDAVQRLRGSLIP
jgi:2-hydroxychromene-2-carboxylate isomerase